MSAYDGSFATYMQAKISKLRDQDKERQQANADAPQLFAGVVVHVDGLTQPSNWELRDLVLRHGGGFEQYYTRSRVTHIIAQSLPSAKQTQFAQCRVARPAWIVDSIAAGRLLEWQRYNALNSVPGQTRLMDVFQAQPPAPIDKDLSLVEFDGDFVVDDCHAAAAAGSLGSLGSQADNGSPEPAVDNLDEMEEVEALDEIEALEEDDPKGSPRYAHDRPELDLNDSWVKHNIATAPNFVERYFAQSRLHHLSTWKNELVSWTRGQREPPVINQAALARNPYARVLMHVDMDCFFAQIAELDNPALRGKPVAVAHGQTTHGKGRSSADVASCNYAAREFGVRNGQSLGAAREKCPNLQVAPFRFERYSQVSRAMYGELLRLCDFVQAGSVDEATVDVTRQVAPLVAEKGQAGARLAVAEELRAAIKQATGCVASVGIGSSILLARLATRAAKPNGVHFVEPQDAAAFVGKQRIRDLPGVGWSAGARLGEMGVTTCAELAALSVATLQETFGPRVGRTLHEFSRGIDPRALANPAERTSVSVEINWGVRFVRDDQVDQFWRQLAVEVVRRLRALGRKAGAVTVRLKKRRPGVGEASKLLGCGICDNYSKTETLARFTDDVDTVAAAAVRVWRAWAIPATEVRGAGIALGRFEPQQSGRAAAGSVANWIAAAPRLDPAVLAELPPDIRAEVERDYGLAEAPKTPRRPTRQLSVADFASPSNPRRVIAAEPRTPTVGFRRQLGTPSSRMGQFRFPVASSPTAPISSASSARLRSSPGGPLRPGRFRVPGGAQELPSSPVSRGLQSPQSPPSPTLRRTGARPALQSLAADGDAVWPQQIPKERNGTQRAEHSDERITQNDFVPSPSQMDAAAFDALPLSLQKEVQRDMLALHRRKQQLARFPGAYKPLTTAQLISAKTPPHVETLSMPARATEPPVEDVEVLSDAPLEAIDALGRITVRVGQGSVASVAPVLGAWVRDVRKRWLAAPFDRARFSSDAEIVETWLLRILDKHGDLDTAMLICKTLARLARGAGAAQEWRELWQSWFSAAEAALQASCAQQLGAMAVFEHM